MNDPDERFDDLPRHIRVRIRREDHWYWCGALKPGAGGFVYGTVYLQGGRSIAAHRLVYERLVGPIEVGLVLDHRCCQRLCCRPSHLEPVTHAENVRRSNSRPDSGPVGSYTVPDWESWPTEWVAPRLPGLEL